MLRWSVGLFPLLGRPSLLLLASLISSTGNFDMVRNGDMIVTCSYILRAKLGAIWGNQEKPGRFQILQFFRSHLGVAEALDFGTLLENFMGIHHNPRQDTSF